MLHLTPSSYRVYLSPCEVQVLKGPLKLGMSATNLSEVPVMSLQVTMWLAPFCAMLLVQSAIVGSSRHRMLCLPEAELVQLQWPGDLQ